MTNYTHRVPIVLIWVLITMIGGALATTGPRWGQAMPSNSSTRHS